MSSICLIRLIVATLYKLSLNVRFAYENIKLGPKALNFVLNFSNIVQAYDAVIRSCKCWLNK